jgi:TDG/mug DNA glycosylase family protein
VPASTAEIDRFLQTELVHRRLGEVRAIEAAAWLDEARLLSDSPNRPGLPLRNLLRAGRIRSGEQRPPQKHGNWFIVRRVEPTADSQPIRRTRSRPGPPEKPSVFGRESSRPAPTTAEAKGHCVTIEWIGKDIETLADLVGFELRVLCIGINPALTSVERGHYYQGRSGQRFLARLRAVGLLPEFDGRWEDDVAFELGIGQTDVVKRPTTKADTISAAEFVYGKRELAKRLEGVHTELVIFTFKEAAKKVFGHFAGHGFVPSFTLCGGEVFVMPGPYEKGDVAEESLSLLRAWVERRASRDERQTAVT